MVFMTIIKYNLDELFFKYINLHSLRWTWMNDPVYYNRVYYNDISTAS